VRPVLDAVAQHVDHPPLADLPLQPGQELPTGRTILVQAKILRRLCLRGTEKLAKLHQVHRVLAVVVAGIAVNPSRAAIGHVAFSNCSGLGGERRSGASHRHADQALQALLGGVGRHASAASTSRSSSSDSPSTSSSKPVSKEGKPSGSSSGRLAAAWRTSSLPVTTSAIRRVR